MRANSQFGGNLARAPRAVSGVFNPDLKSDMDSENILNGKRKPGHRTFYEITWTSASDHNRALSVSASATCLSLKNCCKGEEFRRTLAQAAEAKVSQSRGACGAH